MRYIQAELHAREYNVERPWRGTKRAHFVIKNIKVTRRLYRTTLEVTAP